MVSAARPLAPPHLIDDPTYYPSDDDMGTNTLEILIRELLRPLLAHWLASQGKHYFVGADQFIYYQQFNATRRLAPDLYVLPRLRPEARPPSIKTWINGPPVFALEIASLDWEKDYAESPEIYGKMGTRELIVYDPSWASRGGRGQRFQVFAVERGKGFVCVESTNDIWMPSQELGCCFCEVQTPEGPMLRLSTGTLGDQIIPTELERSEQLANEAARKADEATRKADEATRKADEATRKADEATGGLRAGVVLACELLGIDLTADRQAQLASLDGASLTALLGQLRADRRWPD